MVRPSRLIGIPIVSCFTVRLVSFIVGPLPSATRNVVTALFARPDFCTAYAPRPVAIAPVPRSWTHLEIMVGKALDRKGAIRPPLHSHSDSPTRALVTLQRALT